MPSDPFRLGVLMLETRFPRFPGEVGHPETFSFPVDYERVPGAVVDRVVSGEALPAELQQVFCAAARDLAARGATLITTSCGFLSPIQEELAAASGRPVIASSILLLPLLRSLYGPDVALAVLTFDDRKLGAVHLPPAAGPVTIGGLPREGALYTAIAEDQEQLDQDAALVDCLAAAQTLCCKAPRPAALLLECTNLSPYKATLREALGLPIYDLVDAVLWQAKAAGWSERSKPI